MTTNAENLTVVLVHGAWFDGSSWNRVSAKLLAQGFHVVAAQLPLTSFGDDVTALRRILHRQKPPVLLVGHSYGGAVITAAAAGNPGVAALVYVAAIVPGEGETVGDIFGRVARHPKAPALRPDEKGFMWVTVDAFRDAIAPDASTQETSLLAAAQKPIAIECLREPLASVAWIEKPSWFLIANNDLMVSPETQRYTAERMNARITALAVDHSPMISEPDLVADFISNAGMNLQGVAPERLAHIGVRAESVETAQ